MDTVVTRVDARHDDMKSKQDWSSEDERVVEGTGADSVMTDSGWSDEIPSTSRMGRLRGHRRNFSDPVCSTSICEVTFHFSLSLTIN